MSPPSAFLSQRDRTALRRQYRRGETPVRIVQADHDGRVGLLAVTDRRVLWVARGALRTRVVSVGRDEVADVLHRRERHGSLVVKTKGGRRFEFWMLERGAAEAVLGALGRGAAPRSAPSAASAAPPAAAPSAGAVAFQPAEPPAKAAAPSRAAARPLDGGYLPADTAERRARLKRQLELGTITKREYEWQVESLR